MPNLDRTAGLVPVDGNPNHLRVPEERPAPPAPWQVIQAPARGHDVALAAQPVADADPRARAMGVLIRSAFLSVIWLAITAAAAWLGVLGTLAAVIAWGLLTAGTYLAFDRRERDDSQASVERHRIDAAFDLALAELKSAERMQDRAFDAYLELLERSYPDP